MPQKDHRPWMTAMATRAAPLAAMLVMASGCPSPDEPSPTAGATLTPAPTATAPDADTPSPSPLGPTDTLGPTAAPTLPTEPGSTPSTTEPEATASEAITAGPSPSPSATDAPCFIDPGDLSAAAMEARFVAEIYPLMTRAAGGCANCHFEGSAQVMTLGADGPQTFRQNWSGGFLGDGPDTILDRVTRSDVKAMPLGGPYWSADEQRLMACFVEALAEVDPEPTPTPGGESCQDVDPGTVTLHRLNRAEYNNSVRDLLGDDTLPALGFPVDDRGYGYDNIADVLTTAPLLVEKYSLAAKTLIDDTLGRRPAPVLSHFEVEQYEGTGGGVNSVGYSFGSEGELTVPYVVPMDGRYRLSAMAYGDQAGDEPARMRFSIDGEAIVEIDVPAEQGFAEIYDVEVELPAGAEGFTVAFINDYFNLRAPPGERDRNLIVDWLAVEGPLDAPIPPSERRSAILTCEPEAGQEAACAEEILGTFARRAWRRPIQGDERSRLVALAELGLEQGDDFDTAIRLPLRAALLSPHFLFRVEVDPDLIDPSPHPLSDHELATRLSYFLWGSTPDDTLLALADAGELSQPETVEAEVERMLEDPKAIALTENFAGQWLYIRAMDEAQPDPELFGDFDDELRWSFARQTALGFEAALTENADPTRLLSSDEAFINDRLATHYGLPLVGSDELQRVNLDDPLRGSLLTQGTFHTVTSHTTQTSPVLRGKWVLTQLLCQPPPPPPGNVDPIEPSPGSEVSQREELAQHVSDPACATCHEVMDPIGFGLDQFDAVSQWRTVDDYGFEIDASGVLPPAQPFDGPEELIDLIVADPAYPRCVAQQLMTFAVGRGMEPSDDCAIERAAEGVVGGDEGLRDLIHRITLSEPFTQRRALNEEAQP